MPEYESIVRDIMNQIGKTSVETVFGESRQIGEKVIIPVGKVSYGWGGGGGKAPSAEGAAEAGPEGEGSGMGMGVRVKPIGFITVTADRVTYMPVMDMGPIMLVFSIFLGLTLFKLKSRLMGGRRYHHTCRCPGKYQSMYHKARKKA